MGQVRRQEVALMALAGGVLFAMAITLINVQYHSRTLFVEHERAVSVGHRLKDNQAELLMKIRRASLPGTIAENAQSMGLIPASDENTVSLVIDESPHTVAPSSGGQTP